MGSRTIVSALASIISLAASHAYAEGIAITPKLTYSELRTDSEGSSSQSDSATGLGYGVDFQFRLDDRASIGSEVSIANYEKDQTEASDMALAGYFAYDFISQSNMSVYGKGGLSLHQFAFENFNSASLLNGDLGLGVALAITPTVDFGGEYRYSTTLNRGDMSSDSSNGLKIKDVAIVRNDLSMFVAFKF